MNLVDYKCSYCYKNIITFYQIVRCPICLNMICWTCLSKLEKQFCKKCKTYFNLKIKFIKNNNNYSELASDLLLNNKNNNDKIPYYYMIKLCPELNNIRFYIGFY
jgi:hypothetical protein